MQPSGGQDFFDLTADLFEWEEPDEPHVEVKPPRRAARRPPPRTFKRDLAKLGQAVSDRPTRVTYRFFPDHGFQLHPLAAFARLNVLITKGRRAEVERLAAALVDRGVPVGNALTWEYYFPVNGGPARWTSALAQAAAADALARAGQLLDDRSLSQSAQAAYRAVPAGLSRPLGGGIWVREYGFSDIAILNAQLQTIVSLGRYAAIGPPRTSSGAFRPTPSPCSRSSTRAAGRGIRSTDRRPPSTITAITSTCSASSRRPPARRSGPPRRAAGADISRARGAHPSPRRMLGYPVSAPPT